MHPKLKRCFRFGQYANILFLAFAIVSTLYYWLVNRYSRDMIPLEVAAYTIEVGGFVLMLFSMLNFWKIVRDRHIMKAAMLIYLIVEVVIMVMDFNANRIPFYQSNSMALNIGHSIFSAEICFPISRLNRRTPRSKSPSSLLSPLFWQACSGRSSI